MKYNINDKVKINSFFGSMKPDEEIDDRENYWKLIGESGKIIKIKSSPHPAFPDKGNQVLIQFDKNLNELGLEAHNEEKNTLWFFKSDVRIE